MKKASLVCILALFLTACGLKVPLTVVAGSGTEAGPDGGLAAEGPQAAGAAGIDGGAAADAGAGPDAAGNAGETVSTAGSIFASETEGVTNSTLQICGHVPITGAAPIPHHADRFGQFYFNYVNTELGGVYGRKIKFVAIDDQYYPAGARAAMDRCARLGSFFYVGAAGTDQIVSVAKWAERKRVPYFHGPTSDKDIKGFKYNVHTGPTYEHQHELLAKYLVKRYTKNAVYGMIRVNSPYFDAGHDAFVAELRKLGVTLAVDRVVQKDENQFTDIFVEMQQKGVTVVNNFTTPNLWLKMLNSKPAGFNPTWTAVSPVAGFNIVAAALKGSNSKAVVFHHWSPACNCTEYQTDLDTSAPWYDDEKEFLRIFKKYSPEQNPKPDDFDYASYLSAKGLHRLLLKIGKQPTRTKLWTLLETYKEVSKTTFPGCPAEFNRSNERKGSWRTNIFELNNGKWKQSPSDSCIDSV